MLEPIDPMDIAQFWDMVAGLQAVVAYGFGFVGGLVTAGVIVLMMALTVLQRDHSSVVVVRDE